MVEKGGKEPFANSISRDLDPPVDTVSADRYFEAIDEHLQSLVYTGVSQEEIRCFHELRNLYDALAYSQLKREAGNREASRKTKAARTDVAVPSGISLAAPEGEGLERVSERTHKKSRSAQQGVTFDGGGKVVVKKEEYSSRSDLSGANGVQSSDPRDFEGAKVDAHPPGPSTLWKGKEKLTGAQNSSFSSKHYATDAENWSAGVNFIQHEPQNQHREKYVDLLSVHLEMGLLQWYIKAIQREDEAEESSHEFCHTSMMSVSSEEVFRSLSPHCLESLSLAGINVADSPSPPYLPYLNRQHRERLFAATAAQGPYSDSDADLSDIRDGDLVHVPFSALEARALTTRFPHLSFLPLQTPHPSARPSPEPGPHPTPLIPSPSLFPLLQPSPLPLRTPRDCLHFLEDRISGHAEILDPLCPHLSSIITASVRTVPWSLPAHTHPPPGPRIQFRWQSLPSYIEYGPRGPAQPPQPDPTGNCSTIASISDQPAPVSIESSRVAWKRKRRKHALPMPETPSAAAKTHSPERTEQSHQRAFREDDPTTSSSSVPMLARRSPSSSMISPLPPYPRRKRKNRLVLPNDDSDALCHSSDASGKENRQRTTSDDILSSSPHFSSTSADTILTLPPWPCRYLCGPQPMLPRNPQTQPSPSPCRPNRTRTCTDCVSAVMPGGGILPQRKAPGGAKETNGTLLPLCESGGRLFPLERRIRHHVRGASYARQDVCDFLGNMWEVLPSRGSADAGIACREIGFASGGPRPKDVHDRSNERMVGHLLARVHATSCSTTPCGPIRDIKFHPFFDMTRCNQLMVAGCTDRDNLGTRQAILFNLRDKTHRFLSDPSFAHNPRDNRSVRDIHFSALGDRIVSGWSCGTLTIHSASNAALLHSIRPPPGSASGHHGEIYRMAPHPTKPELFASCGQDRAVHLWNVANGKHAGFLCQGSLGDERKLYRYKPVIDLDFLLSSTTFLVGGCDNNADLGAPRAAMVCVWDCEKLKTHRKLNTDNITGLKGRMPMVCCVQACHIRPDGRWSGHHSAVILAGVATTSGQTPSFGGALLFDVRYEKNEGCFDVLETDHADVNTASFSPCGNFVQVGGLGRSNRGLLTVHDLRHRQKPLHSFAHDDIDYNIRPGDDRDGISAVEWCPSSNYIVSAGDDRAVRVWDLRRGQCVKCIRAHSSAVLALGVAPAARLLFASGGEDDKVVLCSMDQRLSLPEQLK